MRAILSSAPCLELKPYVRAYAQRELELDSEYRQPVVASLEQVLEFDLATPPSIQYSDGTIDSAGAISIVGAHSWPRASLLFSGRVCSFAVFFQPTAFWQLFGIPNSELMNQAHHGTDVMGTAMKSLWNAIAEVQSFKERVVIIEEFLRRRARIARSKTPIMSAAMHLFRKKGMMRIDVLADQSGLNMRHLERKFLTEVGISPKLFAKVTRFQAALDAKITSPDRSWLSIAHAFGYHDQMHMVRDFHSLGASSPNSLFARLGDGRPQALAASTPPEHE